ncbi:helix-turn-helix transcriptional regulator [Wenyingzhuangia sp. IMCC45533]
MLNQEKFINRLHKLFDHYNLTAAVFADEIKVQRSSISHLLSGRNKPSLEFVLKITAQYKEVTLDWLLYGKGSFPKATDNNETNDLHNSSPPTSDDPKFIDSNTIQGDTLAQKKTTLSNDIERIVIFYSNGTFKEYL